MIQNESQISRARWLIYTALFCSTMLEANAQSQYRFKHFDTNNGLANELS